MEDEASLFETSEMLGVFLASTPLLSQSWRICSIANTTAPGSFVVDQIGDVGYVAFSGIQSVAGLNPNVCNLIPLSSVGNGLFSSFHNHNEEEEKPAMVHAGLAHIFLSIWNCPGFQNQMSTIMEKCKAVIITGHSIGGASASLAALWLLSYLQSTSLPLSVLCITFGSPLLGNGSLSRMILRERWGGNFCHMVLKHDIVPRLLYAPLASITPQVNCLLQLWHLSMTSPQFGCLATQLPDEEKTEFCHYILGHVAEAASSTEEDSRGSQYRPFGSYLFCTEEGAICVENMTAIVRLMHLMFMTGTENSSIEDHLKYGDAVMIVSQQLLKRKCTTQVVLPESCYEAGISLALEASGIVGQDTLAEPAKECLKTAKRMGRMPNLNSANLANCLAKVTPYRAEIEWYQASCDESDDQMGYYDTFKISGASKRHFKVNMNRLKLANFWNNVIDMLDTNQLPYYFHKRAKWVNASHFYKLLVEPLDIAEYYRSGMHRTKGHYLKYGRERRYEIFDRWWRDGEVKNENRKRSKYAGLTQDSCFWARVEEARESLEDARSENDMGKLTLLWENIHKFELYSRQLIDSREVSKDVIAKNSSYTLWVEDLKELRSQLTQIPPPFPGYLDGELVP